jgi:hypothetical protein
MREQIILHDGEFEICRFYTRDNFWEFMSWVFLSTGTASYFVVCLNGTEIGTLSWLLSKGREHFMCFKTEY